MPRRHIAKHKDSHYKPGLRSYDWGKYKINKCQDFVIGGYTPRNPFDAVIVGYYDGDKLPFAGEVRAGFVPHARRELMAQMKQLPALVRLPIYRRNGAPSGRSHANR